VNDVSLLKDLIYELAQYERQPDLVVITEADLVRDGFGPQPKFRVLIAEWDGQPAGYALFFGIYSTWEGRPGLFLEDLLCGHNFGARESARRCLLTSPALPSGRAVTPSAGKCWTGINPLSTSTKGWELHSSINGNPCF
jgi:hypothetical protein